MVGQLSDLLNGLPGLSRTGVTAPSSSEPAGKVSSVARNSALSMVALVVLGGTRVVYGSLISRVTDRETYGLIGVLIAVTMIATFLLPAGIGSAISRYVPFNRGRDDLPAARGVYRFLARVGWLGALGLTIGAFLVAFAGLHRPIGQSVEVALLTLTYSLYTTQKAALYGFGRVARYAQLELVASAVILILTLAVIATASTWYLTPFIIGYAVFAAAGAISVRRDAAGEATAVRPNGRRELVGFVFLACLGTLTAAGFLQGTQFLAALFAAPAELAYFTAAVALTAPMYFLPRALALALFPSMSEAHGAGDVDAVRRHADLATRGLLAVLTPLFVAGILLSAELMEAFGGSRYVDGAGVLRLILAGAFLSVLQVGSVNALSSGSNWQLRTPVTWAVVGCTVGLLSVAFLGPTLGATGVALAYLLGTAVGAAGPMIVVWRRHAMPWAGPGARALACLGAAILVAGMLPVPPSSLERLAIHGVAAIVVVALALAILARDIHAMASMARKGLRTPADAAAGLGAR